MHETVRDAVRVASVPAGHPYVRAVSAHPGVTVLPDPLPDPDQPQRWWPPVMLDAGWVREHADAFDVFHLHFGAESYDAEHLARFTAALAEAGRPLVYTVHDLENPQLDEQRTHAEALDVLVPAAAELVTLTASAAEEIERRWGRSARVLPHPSMLLHEQQPELEPIRFRVVGVHLRDLRPNILGAPLAAALAEAADLLLGAGPLRFEISMHERVRDEAQAEEIARIVAAAPRLELLRRPRLGDEALEREIAGLDAALLPYRHGTHSGWLELCYDLGVPVVGPRAGHFAGQHPSSYSAADLLDARSLADAIAAALDRPESPALDDARAVAVRERRAERMLEAERVRDAHAALYAAVAR